MQKCLVFENGSVKLYISTLKCDTNRELEARCLKVICAEMNHECDEMTDGGINEKGVCESHLLLFPCIGKQYYSDSQNVNFTTQFQ